jgi:hypothetical protein
MATLGPLLARAANLTKHDRSPEERTALQGALKDLRSVIDQLAPATPRGTARDRQYPLTFHGFWHSQKVVSTQTRNPTTAWSTCSLRTGSS